MVWPFWDLHPQVKHQSWLYWLIHWRRLQELKWGLQSSRTSFHSLKSLTRILLNSLWTNLIHIDLYNSNLMICKPRMYRISPCVQVVITTLKSLKHSSAKSCEIEKSIIAKMVALVAISSLGAHASFMWLHNNSTINKTLLFSFYKCLNSNAQQNT